MPNPFCHIELHTTDSSKAKAFYDALMDWKMEDMEVGGDTYTMIHVGEGTGGGMMKNPVPGVPSHWLPYILVDDVAVSSARAEELGGRVIKEKTEVPGFGWFAVISDPTEAVVGIWQSKPAE